MRRLAPIATCAFVFVACGGNSAKPTGAPTTASSASAIPSATASASASTAAVEPAIPIEQLTCTNGALPEGALAKTPPLTAPSASAGSMWGDSVGDSFGQGGLGLSGVGEGAGTGEGIGLGSVGTLGKGPGTGTGVGYSGPSPTSIVGAPIDAKGARAKAIAAGACGATAAIRKCGGTTGATGDLELELAIDASGKVTAVKRTAGSLADDKAIACVTTAMTGLAFEPAAAGVARYKWTLSLRPKPSSVKMRDAGNEVKGRLPPEVVRRIVRANFPRFRLCYEQGLKRDAKLAGGVTTKFTITKDGAVTKVASAGGTLVDAGVRDCVTGVFKTLSFPEPEGGVVDVTYPIAFENDP
jgi:hypothetical protein